MKEGREYGSNLATPGAVIICFVLFLTAAGFGQAELAVFLFIVFLFSLIAWAWSRHSLSKLKVSLRGGTVRVFPGSEISFTLTVKNDKLLPLLWLTAEYDEAVRGFIDLRDRHIGAVGPGRSVSVSESVRAKKRGIYHLKGLTLASGDGLGLAVSRGRFEPDEKLLIVVYPELVPIDARRLPRSSTEMDAGSRGYIDDVTLLQRVRPYSPGDPAKRINWRMLAGGGETQINMYEQILPRQSVFVIDLEAFGLFEEKEEGGGTVRQPAGVDGFSMESALSYAASVITVLVSRRELMSLVIPSYSGLKGVTASGQDPDEAVPEMLTALAGINYEGGPAAFSGRELGSAGGGDVYVFSGREPSKGCLGLLAGIPEHRVHIFHAEGGRVYA